MADKSRERNSVDIFSDYGLDERQIAIQNKIAFSCFRLLFNIGVIMSVVWIVLLTGSYKYDISGSIVALSYYIAIILCYCIYAVRASKHGVINGITATSLSKELITAVICVVGAIIIPFVSLFDEPWIFSLLLVLAAVRCVIFYFCGKRNFKVLDEQMKEDEEDE